MKLLLRFADTKAQKILKQQSNERRAYRAGEYNYSVEVVQGSTPSPSMRRGPHLTPNSQVSYTSPAGVGSNWTPATTISPWYVPASGVTTQNNAKYTDCDTSHPHMKHPSSSARDSSLSSRSLNALDNTSSHRGRALSLGRRSYTDLSGGSSKTILPGTSMGPHSYTSSPRKENIRASSVSPESSPMVSLSPARSCA